VLNYDLQTFISNHGHLDRFKLSALRIDLYVKIMVVLPDPFQRLRAQRNSAEIQQSGHAQGVDQRLKMEEVVPEMAHLRYSDARNSKRIRSFSWCLHALQEEFSFRFTCI